MGPDGGLRWLRKWEGLDQYQAMAVSATQAGGFVLGGATRSLGGAVDRVWATRVDRWGEVACFEGSVCGDVTPKQCDDGNLCTLDDCNPLGDADNPCIHPPANPCDDGDACTDDSCTMAEGACVFVMNLATCPAVCDDGDDCPAGGDCSVAHCAGGGCETPPKAWDTIGQSPTYSEARDVAVTTDGRLVAVGWVNNTSADGTPKQLYARGFDMSGKATWSMELGGEAGDKLLAVTPVEAGGVVGAGQVEADGAIIRLHATGAVAWTTVLGGSGADIFNGLTATSDNGFVAVGTRPTGAYDAWMVKVDAAGQVLWEGADLGLATTQDALADVIELDDTQLLAAGHRQPGPGLPLDVLLVKYSPLGQKPIQWTFGDAAGDDAANALIALKAGGVVIGGVTASTPTGDQDALVIRVAPDFSESWSVHLGAAGPDTVHDVAETEDGGVLAVGTTDKDTAWAWRLDGDGNLLWQRDLAGPGLHRAEAIVPAPGGGYLVAITSFLSPAQLRVQRLDEWGVSTCDGISKCLELKQSQCDGGTGCTLADCDAFTGCTYEPKCQGLSVSDPAASCLAIQQKSPAAPSGPYWLAAEGVPAYQAYCDMDTDGGGWTLILNVLEDMAGIAEADVFGTGHEIAESFIFGPQHAKPLGDAATEIRFHCKYNADQLHLKNSGPEFLKRGWDTGDRCDDGYHWDPEVNGFVGLDGNTVAVPPPKNTSTVSCTKAEQPLIWLTMGLAGEFWQIHDSAYPQYWTRLCINAQQDAEFHRIWYR